MPNSNVNTKLYSLNKNIKIGIDKKGTREEFDSMGTINVPAEYYWGAQTQRSLQHFNIGNDLMPKEIYHAYGYIKNILCFSKF